MADAPDTTDVTGGTPVTGGPSTGGPAIGQAAANVSAQQAIAQQLYGPQPAPPAASAPPPPAWNTVKAGMPAPAPAAAAPGPAAAPEPDNWGARMYHGILGALGGTQDITMHRDSQTGEMQVTKVASTPGTQWKRIIAGALAGVAGGGGQTGPGAMSRALQGGVQGGLNLAKERQETMEKQANEDQTQQRETMIANAQNAILTQERSARDFELSRKKVESRYLDNDKLQSFMQEIIDGGGTDLGVFPDAAAAMQHVNQDPTAVNMLAHGRLAMMPVMDEQNNYAGNHYAIIPEGWDSQQIDRDMPMPNISPPTTPGGNYSVKWESIPANTPGMTKGKYQTLFSAQIGFLEKLDHTEMQNNEAASKTTDLKGPDGKTHTYGWNPKTQMYDRDQGITQKAPTTAIYNQDRADAGMDRLNTRMTKPYEKGVEAAGGQIDKINDARSMINGSAEAQALGIPKVLTAVVGGQGTGVRITMPELQAIATARGIQGDFEGWVNQLSGKGKLTKTQQQQLTGVLDDAKKRIMLKEQIYNDTLDAMNGAGSRDEIIAADRAARTKLAALERGETQAAAPAASGTPPAAPAQLPPAATGGFDWNAQKDHKPAGAQ